MQHQNGLIGQTALYNVSDVFQTLGIRDRRFDTIVLHCTGSGSKSKQGSEFEKYAAFLMQPDQPEYPQNVSATFVYYDRVQGNFWSDGMYRNYLFDPKSATMAEKAFYIISSGANVDCKGKDQNTGQEETGEETGEEECLHSPSSQNSCTTDYDQDPICHSDTDSD